MSEQEGYLRKQLRHSDVLNAWDAGQNNLLKAENEQLKRLLEEALHLRMHGEYAPGGAENWPDWERKTETYLRSLLGPEPGSP